MAFSVTGPLSHAAPVRMVSSTDSAVDWLAMDGQGVNRYLETLDESTLRFRAGETPTWFYLGDIPRSVMVRSVKSAPTEIEVRFRAFMWGVTKIENLYGKSGAIYPMIEPQGEAQGPQGTIRYWTDAQIEEVAPIYLEEIGYYAFQKNDMDPKGERRWLALASSRREILRNAYRHVEEKKREAYAAKLRGAVAPGRGRKRAGKKSGSGGRVRARKSTSAAKAGGTDSKSGATATKSDD